MGYDAAKSGKVFLIKFFFLIFWDVSPLSSSSSYLEHLDGDLSRRLAARGGGGDRDRRGAVGAEEHLLLLLRLLLLLLQGLLTHQVLSHQNSARTRGSVAVAPTVRSWWYCRLKWVSGCGGPIVSNQGCQNFRWNGFYSSRQDGFAKYKNLLQFFQ